MNKELETLINNLEDCIGIFDYMLTPIENNLLLSYINELQQENNQLKEQYCERTDCGGRLGNSKKVERLENTIKELRSWLEEEINKGGSSVDIAIKIHSFSKVLDKLNELEGGKNE